MNLVEAGGWVDCLEELEDIGDVFTDGVALVVDAEVIAFDVVTLAEVRVLTGTD